MRPVGAVLIHADRRMDMMKLIDAFRIYANAPNKATAFGAVKILFWGCEDG
jgi:hypothetical protein